jgi:hypothetical protein
MAPSGHSQDYLCVLTFCYWTLGCSVPSVFHFDANHNLLRHSFQGRLTDTALVEGYYKAGKYVARHPPNRIITDFSAVTSIEVSSQTVRTIASTPPKLPVAFSVQVARGIPLRRKAHSYCVSQRPARRIAHPISDYSPEHSTWEKNGTAITARQKPRRPAQSR